MGKITFMSKEHKELNKLYCQAIKRIHEQAEEIRRLKAHLRQIRAMQECVSGLVYYKDGVKIIT